MQYNRKPYQNFYGPLLQEKHQEYEIDPCVKRLSKLTSFSEDFAGTGAQRGEVSDETGCKYPVIIMYHIYALKKHID